MLLSLLSPFGWCCFLPSFGVGFTISVIIVNFSTNINKDKRDRIPKRCEGEGEKSENTHTAQTALVFLYLEFLSQRHCSSQDFRICLFSPQKSGHSHSWLLWGQKAPQTLSGFVVTEDTHLSQVMSPSSDSMSRRILLMRNGQATPIPLGGNLSRSTMSSSLPITSDTFRSVSRHFSFIETRMSKRLPVRLALCIRNVFKCKLVQTFRLSLCLRSLKQPLQL